MADAHRQLTERLPDWAGASPPPLRNPDQQPWDTQEWAVDESGAERTEPANKWSQFDCSYESIVTDADVCMARGREQKSEGARARGREGVAAGGDGG